MSSPTVRSTSAGSACPASTHSRPKGSPGFAGVRPLPEAGPGLDTGADLDAGSAPTGGRAPLMKARFPCGKGADEKEAPADQAGAATALSSCMRQRASRDATERVLGVRGVGESETRAGRWKLRHLRVPS